MGAALGYAHTLCRRVTFPTAPALETFPSRQILMQKSEKPRTTLKAENNRVARQFANMLSMGNVDQIQAREQNQNAADLLEPAVPASSEQFFS